MLYARDTLCCSYGLVKLKYLNALNPYVVSLLLSSYSYISYNRITVIPSTNKASLFSTIFIRTCNTQHTLSISAHATSPALFSATNQSRARLTSSLLSILDAFFDIPLNFFIDRRWSVKFLKSLICTHCVTKWNLREKEQWTRLMQCLR